jgi:hypothetical protein
MTQTTPLARLFLHFFDIHFLKEVAVGRSLPSIENEVALATRLALLAAKTVYVPAASYFESPMCQRIIDDFTPIFDQGALVLVGNGANIQDFASIKVMRYPEGSLQHARYQKILNGEEVAPPFRPRMRSATEDLHTLWIDQGKVPNFATSIFGNIPIEIPAAIEKEWHLVPNRLAGRAFTPEYVVPLLLGNDPPLIMANRVAGLINSGYFASFARELQAGLVTDLVFMSGRSALISGSTNLPYRAVVEEFRRAGLLKKVISSEAEELVELRELIDVQLALLKALRPPNGIAFDHNPSRAGLQLQLPAVTSPIEQVTVLRAIPRGKRTATAYHRQIASLLQEIFIFSFGPAAIEQEIDQGRKRLDIVYPNIAERGFFRWLSLHRRASHIIVECKNYTAEVANPELDQLTGRYAPWRSEVGLLVNRQISDKGRLIARCRDAAQAGRGIVIPLDDDDLATLASADLSPDWNSFQSRWLYDRTNPLVM